MNYRPNEMNLWDTWCIPHGKEVHAFYMQRRAKGSSRTLTEERSIGHAVSDNLLDWKELPTAVMPGEVGSGEDLDIFTGCAFEKNDDCFLYYTQRSSEDGGLIQRIALATSRDWVHFTKFSGNPVIEPDPDVYCTREHPARHGIVDCRDLIVVENPDGEGYYGFFAARRPSEEMPEGAAIACVYSKDLYHWENVGPVFTAKTNTIVEVPDVFCMNGRWYLTMLVSNEYGSRDLFSEQELIQGTVYAVSDKVTGPYVMEPDNVILASRRQNGITCRSVMFEGKRMLLYTRVEREGERDDGAPSPGSLSTPKEYRLVDGKLRAVYSPLVEEKCSLQRITQEVLHRNLSDYRVLYSTPAKWQVDDDRISGRIRTCWDRYQMELRGEAFMFSADITLDEGAAAGLVLKQSDGYSGYGVILDFNWQKLLFAVMPRVEILDARSCVLEHGKTYHLRVVCTGIHYDIFLDDVLMIQTVSYRYKDGICGLFLDRGRGSFEYLDFRTLDV